MSPPQPNIFENANQNILIAKLSVECNNYNKIGVTIIFIILKWKQFSAISNILIFKIVR